MEADVPPLWCLLLADAQVVEAITTPPDGTETPRYGLRLSLETALANWQRFCAYIDQHPQFYRVPALGTYLAAVADFLRHTADEMGQSLAELWLQGDLDAVSGPFDANVSSRIDFWKWNADSRMETLRDDSAELHDLTLVLDIEDLDDWVRSFGLKALDHPYFRTLWHLDDFPENAPQFDAFEEAAEPVIDPWQGHNYRTQTAADGQVGMVAQEEEEGGWHVAPQWDEIRPDSDSYVRVWVRKAQQWGVLQIEPTVELLFAPQFEAIVDSVAGDLAVARQNGREGVIDINARTWRVPPVHEALQHECVGLFRLKQEDRYGYLDERGTLVVQPRYEQTHPFGGHGLFDAPNVAWVVQNGLWGLIDAQGRELQPCRFQRMEYREEHDHRGWRVWQQDRQGWVGADGALAVACEWDEVDTFERYAHSCQAEGLYRVTLAGKQGLVPRMGNWRIACQYEDIEPLGVGYGAPVLPIDPWRMSPEPEEGDLSAYLEQGDPGQSRLLIRVVDSHGTGVIDEAGRQIVPMADWRIETIGADNLRWLRVQNTQGRYQLWSVVERAPLLPDWHDGVDILARPSETPIMLTFAERQDGYSIQFWLASGQPAVEGRFIGLLGEHIQFGNRLSNDAREALSAAWSSAGMVEAREQLEDGSERSVFIRPGALPVEAREEWERRYRQGDLSAALALSHSSQDPQQAYTWAQRACDGAVVSPAAVIRLFQLVLQGLGDADALIEARQWVERGLAEVDDLGEELQLLLLQGRLCLNENAGPLDADQAFTALERAHLQASPMQSTYVEVLHLLGQCWRAGLGCPADTEQARHHWREAAALGHGPSAQALIELLVEQAEQQTAPEDAERLWQEALHHAEYCLEHFTPAESPWLHNFIGTTLLQVEPTDWHTAEAHLKEAAAAGHTEAMGALASVVYRERSSPLRNRRESVHWALRFAGLANAPQWQRWVFAVFWLLRR